MGRKRLKNTGGFNQEGVKVVTGPAGCKRKPAGINIVRSFLKGVICLPDALHAAVIPMDTIVFPAPPRKAEIKIRGKSISFCCIRGL